jgi:peptide/nickel transport system substrate-binding protein
MQPTQPYADELYDSPSPAESIGRHLPWLVALALGGIAILVVLLAYSTYTVPTVLAPDRGGVFREGVAGAARYLSPFWCQEKNADRDICRLVYRGLTRIDKSGRIVPDLAEGWVMVDDRTYLFTLKPNQFWHDGRAITTNDVLFTIGLLQDPTIADIPGLRSIWSEVAVEQVDDYTVRFSLPQPLAPFLDNTTLGLLPQHIYAETPPLELVTQPLTQTPIGSGPMQVSEVTAEYVRLTPSRFYAGPTPYISTLEFRFYPDYQRLVAAFDAGEIDGISRVLPADIQAAAARDDLQLFSSVESGYEDVLFNLGNPNTPFFQDKRVRQALLYAVDREALAADALSGQAVVAHSLLTPENWAYNPNVTHYGYDPDRAAALLDEAGWRDSDGDGIRDREGSPLAFVLLVEDDNLHRAIGEQLAAFWRAVGVDAQVTPVLLSGMVADFLAPRTFEAALTDWDQAGDPDPYPQWHSSQITGGQNYAGWNHAEVDALLEQGRQTTDLAQRRALYHQFQAIYAEELPSLPLYYPVYTYGVSKRVNNVQIGSLNDSSERFADFARWYIDSQRVPANQVPPDIPPTPPGGAG